MTLLSRGAATEALLQAARVVATTERPAEALAAVLSAARQCLGATGAAILRADGRELLPLASDALAVAAGSLDAPPALGAQAVLYPLGSAERVEGALVLAGVAPERRSEDDPALPILLDLAAGALRKRRTTAEQDQVRALRALHEVAVAASGVLDPAALAQLVVDHLRDLLAVESASLYLWDAEAGLLHHLGYTGTPPTASRPTVQSGEGIIGQAFQRREPVVVDDYPTWEHALAEPLQRRARAAAGVPLLVGDHPIGALMIRTSDERRFTREEVQILSLFAAQVAPAVEAARLYALSEQRRGEAAAREAELATVIEHLTCGVMVLDARGELVLANEVSRRIRGDRLGQSEPLAHFPGGLVLREPDGQPVRPVDTAVARALRGEFIPRYEYRLRRPGETDDVWVEGSVAPLRDPNGDVTSVVAVIQDVTQERQLGRELAASEERLRTLYQAMACAIVVRNARGETVDANAAAEEMLGLSLAGMRARGPAPLWPALHEDGTPLLEAERPHRVALRTGQAVRGTTFGVVRGDGEYRWLRADAVPVLGPDGKPLYVVSSAIDVTERVRAEEAVRRSEERARSLIENLTDVIMIVDPAGILRYVSPSVERCLGYRPDTLVGQGLWAYVHADDAETVRATLAEAQATPDVGLPTGCRARHRDGAWRALELVCQNHLHDPSVGGIVVNARDVTERQEAARRLQELAQADKLRALGQMASGVAHDLNQYLGLVAGHGDLALRALDSDAPDVESARDSLGIVVQAAMDGGETVKRLLVFARPREDGIGLPLDLGELLREVAKLTAPQWRDAAQAQGRPISLHVEVEGHTVVAGSPQSLREAFTNLVLNAVDALPHGGTIRLVARRRGERVEAEVVDTGVGMSAAVRARVFEPFFSTKGERGTGLGLAVVYGIVERHHGEIGVDSLPGRGTVFHLSLPAASGAAVGELPSVAPAPPAARRILAVDDDPALARMAAAMLASDGHTVVLAASGEEALARLAREPFDLVLSDLGMGAGMNGWELADAVRTHHPGVRFCLATGWGMQIDAEEAAARGVAAVVAKPFRIDDLKQAVNLLLAV